MATSASVPRNYVGALWPRLHPTLTLGAIVFLSPNELLQLRLLNKSWALAHLPRLICSVPHRLRFLHLVNKTDRLDPILLDYCTSYEKLMRIILDAIVPSCSNQDNRGSGHSVDRHWIWRACAGYSPVYWSNPLPALMFGLTVQQIRDRLLQVPFKVSRGDFDGAFLRSNTPEYINEVRAPQDNTLRHFVLYDVEAQYNEQGPTIDRFKLNTYKIEELVVVDPIFQIPEYQVTHESTLTGHPSVLFVAMNPNISRKYIARFMQELQCFKMLVDTKQKRVHVWSSSSTEKTFGVQSFSIDD